MSLAAGACPAAPDQSANTCGLAAEQACYGSAESTLNFFTRQATNAHSSSTLLDADGCRGVFDQEDIEQWPNSS